MTKRKAIACIGVVVVALVAVYVLVVYSGVYSVTAAKPHTVIEGELLNKIMVESVRPHARNIRVPAGMNLHDPALAEKTTGNENACRTCHGVPGAKPDVWVYLYRPPPDLTLAAVVAGHHYGMNKKGARKCNLE